MRCVQFIFLKRFDCIALMCFSMLFFCWCLSHAWVLQATLKIAKTVAPGLAVTLSDEFPDPHKKGKVRCTKLFRCKHLEVPELLIAVNLDNHTPSVHQLHSCSTMLGSFVAYIQHFPCSTPSTAIRLDLDLRYVQFRDAVSNQLDPSCLHCISFVLNTGSN